jgi:hypothetical protein
MPVRKALRHAAVILAFIAVLTGIGLLGRDSGWPDLILILAIGSLMLVWAFQRNQDVHSRSRLPAGRDWPGGGEIIPRPDATPEQLKRLGTVLTDWWDLEGAGATPAVSWIDRPALDDLLAGELPQPFVLRLLTEMNRAGLPHGPLAYLALPARMTTQQLREALHKARDFHPQLARSIPQEDSRTIPFGLGNASSEGRRQIIAGLRRIIPAGLVEDILIDGQSWEIMD